MAPAAARSVTKKENRDTDDDHEEREQREDPPESPTAAPHVPRTMPIHWGLLWTSRLLSLLCKR
jgi:hypothetical protein